MVYGSPYSNPYGSSRARVQPVAPSSTGLGNLLSYLDVPGQYARGLLAGRPGERLSGTEFNQAYGLGDSALAGLGTEILLDPLNLLGVGALTKAGRVVSKAGRLGRAGEYLTKAAQAGKAAPEIARRAEQAAGGAANLSRLSAAEIAGKPLVRPRAATRFGTARQIASGMDNADEAADLLKKASGLEDAALSKDIGIGLPFMNPLLSFNVPGGAAARDMVDTAVKGLKFSPIGRGVRYALDSSVGNTFDEASQVLASGSKVLADEAVARETRKGVESARRLIGESGVDVTTDEGNLALGDLIERPKGADLTGEVADDPAVKAYVDWWEKESKRFLDESKAVGIGSEALDDPNLGGYLPRSYTAISDDAYKSLTGGVRQKPGVASVGSGDQMARQDFMRVPGGRRAIVELSTDPDLIKGTSLTTEQAADKIGLRLFGDAASERDSTMKLAKLLSNLDPEKLPKGLFSENPTEAITAYMQRRGRAIQNAKSITEYVASKATRASDGIAGEPMISVAEALKDGGLRTDGKDAEELLSSVREMIGRTQGIPADSVSLTEYVVPKSLKGVLAGATGTRSVTELSNFDKIVKATGDLWRNSILGWPSRYVRDLVGGNYVNFLEGALSWFGNSGAWRLLRGRAVDAPEFLRKIPAYANIADDAALTAKFYADLAATGLADGTIRYDLGQSRALRTTLPGIDPIAPNFGKMARGVFGRKGVVPDLLRPDSTFYRETGALNDFVDTYNRLAGYLELLRQGVDPMEAGKRMTRAHIDYTGLTDVEQRVRKYIPFYTYTSRMAQETGRKLVEQPRRLVASGRVIDALPELFGDNEGGDNYIPKSMRERVAVPFSSDSTGKTVGYNVDVPGIESINWMFGDRPVDSALSSVNPQLNALIEQVTQRDTFTGRPLKQVTTPLGRAVGGDNELTRLVDRIGQMAPLYPRVSRVVADLAEDRGAAPPGGRYAQTAINAFTGYKVRRLTREDLDRQLAYELEDQVEPYSREYATSYIPEETFATMPPEAQRAWLALQQLRKARRQANAR